MSKENMCNCKEQSTLIDISNNHSDFKSQLNQLDVGDWVMLMQCLECEQLYKVDEWDKYQSCYAVKISSKENWEAFDIELLVKKRMVKNRNGLTNNSCMRSGCSLKQVKGSAFCVNHLYEGRTRA